MSSTAGALIRAGMAGLLGALVLLSLAGTWRWWGGSASAVVLALATFLSTKVFLDHPALAEERRTAAKRAQPWDRALVAALNLVLPLTAILAGLDRRFAWSWAVPAVVSWVAFATAVAGCVLTYQALRSNAYFSSHVRVQTDRQQVVVSHGPYAFVRHPGYAGALLLNLASPLLFGSLVSACVAWQALPILVVRIYMEERVLLAGLEGYAGYRERVRWRLLPGIW